jgi:hypothetical protein
MPSHHNGKSVDWFGQEGRPSFLKKRSKKLLQMARCTGGKRVNLVPPETDKSFLVLFFKKEQLP